jgi:hypothetical protein
VALAQTDFVYKEHDFCAGVVVSEKDGAHSS